jgi:hypothetical protein
MLEIQPVLREHGVDWLYLSVEVVSPERISL